MIRLRNITFIPVRVSPNRKYSTNSLFDRDHHGFLGITVIPESTTGIMTRFGKFQKMLEPGFHFYIPMVNSVYRVNNRLIQEDVDVNVITEEAAFVTIRVAIQFKVYDSDSRNAFYQFSNAETQIRSYVENSIRSTVPKYKLIELYNQRNEISNTIKDYLEPRMHPYGFNVFETQILDISPSREVRDAMNAVISSQKSLEATKNEAEANKIKLIKEAEADAERRILQGRGTAGQRREIMQGYEDGVEDMVKKLGVSPAEILEFLVNIQRLDTYERIGTTPTTAKTVFLANEQSNSLVNSLVQGKES